MNNSDEFNNDIILEVNNININIHAYIQRHYSIEEESKGELLFNDYNDPLSKEIFLNALKIYSNEKIPRKIAQEMINDQVKLVNNHCLRNNLPLFNPENVKSEYMLFKHLKKMKILFCAKTVLIKKEYELFNNKTNNSEFKEVEFIPKLVKGSFCSIIQ